MSRYDEPIRWHPLRRGDRPWRRWAMYELVDGRAVWMEFGATARRAKARTRTRRP
jgi:hypothetical protein